MSTRVTVAEVLHKPGAVRDISVELELPHVELPLAEVVGPVRLDGALEGVLEGVVVAGSATAQVQMSCARCLHTEVRPVVAAVAELFSADPGVEADDDVYPVAGEEIDLGQMLVDAVVLAVPESPVLCDGPPRDCPRYLELQAATPDGVTTADTGGTDPRWAALSGLLEQMERES
ncbi:MAG: YceD family protein [Acidimicrobiia bacterium]|nr:YceD family protein [Acidimicrobiia bacterium]